MKGKTKETRRQGKRINKLTGFGEDASSIPFADAMTPIVDGNEFEAEFFVNNIELRARNCGHGRKCRGIWGKRGKLLDITPVLGHIFGSVQDG